MTSRKNLFPLLIYIIWSVAFMSAPAQTTKQIKNLQSQSSALKGQIAESEKLLRSTKKDVKSQLSNLVVINSQIEQQQVYVDSLGNEVSRLQSDIDTLESQRAVLQSDLNKCKAQYRRAVNYMHRNRSSQSKFMFLLQSKTFHQMRRRMRYVQEFSKFQRRQGELIQKKEAELLAKQQEISALKSEKDKNLAEGKMQQQKLQHQQRERQNVVNELNKKQAQLQSNLAQQKKKYNSLNAEIDRLIQIEVQKAEARRRAEEKRRREEAARRERERQALLAKSGSRSSKSKGKGSKRREETEESRSRTYDYRAADNADSKLSGSFAANKGRLPVPITGPYVVSSHFGTYNVEGLRGVQLDNKGINLTGQSGAQARCVFDGEVSAVFSAGGLYNIIVRHGSYMSVYCNLSGVSVRRGQKVSARQTLGSIARDAAGNCTLQFQLRKELTKLNPEAWIRR